MAEAQGESAEFQSDRGVFRAEYERELGQWLRRRLGWLCIAYTVFQLVGTATVIGGGLLFEALSKDPTEEVVETGVGAPRSEDGATGRASTTPSAPIGRIVDRWWEDNILPITDGGRAADAGAGDAAATDGAESGGSDATEDAAPDGAAEIPTESPAQQPSAAANGELAVDDVAEGVNEAVAAQGTDGAVGERTSSRNAIDATEMLHVPWWVWALLSLPSLGVVAWYGLKVRPKLYTRAELVAAATRMILTLGFLNFGLETGMLLVNPEATAAPLFSIFFWHLTASLFLPWNWRESLKPIVPLFLCWVLLRAGLAAGDGSWISAGLAVGFAPLLFVPALVLCYARLRWHQNRFKTGFVGRRFVQMRREFLQARAVHESLFPKPLDAGWMRFDFGYRPAADIGGDFIHVWVDDQERFHLALIDVTGHGLASAMSVARIHGEIERLRDEYPDEGPARILARLNRYFHRLLARHKLYATGVLLTLDPNTGEVRYASAGHPPVFLRSRGGVTEMPSTTFLLGAVDDSMFGEEEVTIRLEEGDTLVLFTDGAYDARNPRGERFGLDRLREIISRPTAPPRWTQYLMRLVETFEAGMPEDDLLIAEVSFMSRRSLSSITGDDLPMPAQSRAESRAAAVPAPMPVAVEIAEPSGAVG
jgi:hypothetical protein